MVSEACCNRDRTQAVFPDPVIPAIMEVKGCSKRNRWHFCENIGTVWNEVRPALRCVDIKCLCILSFLLKDFWQMEQNQLISTPQEQNVDWERGRMWSIYIGFQAIKLYCFLPAPPAPPPPPPHFYCFPSSTTTATSLLISLHLHHHRHHHRHHHISIVLFHHQRHHHISIVFPPPPQPRHFYYFPSTRFYKRIPTAILSSFCSNVSCSEQQSWFSSTVSWSPCFLHSNYMH